MDKANGETKNTRAAESIFFCKRILAERLYVKKSTISYYETDNKEMRASWLAEIARVLYTTPDYLLGFEEEKDPFEKEALCILQGIKNDTVREMLLKQMKALV